ncbi:hypothetical protein BC938DRAFT_479917 [Jimgerdemannia flammicorona]|uniref:Uncharacterized protein n=1 Tax=Jimgerdemannia flammicorona TaxID=994334 RepID=A0A433QJT9_9FUNG|nr:hypothetical protein BC938DRAFT_479917 [Jimgerdemannia flammicorona]
MAASTWASVSPDASDQPTRGDGVSGRDATAAVLQPSTVHCHGRWHLRLLRRRDVDGQCFHLAQYQLGHDAATDLDHGCLLPRLWGVDGASILVGHRARSSAGHVDVRARDRRAMVRATVPVLALAINMQFGALPRQLPICVLVNGANFVVAYTAGKYLNGMQLPTLVSFFLFLFFLFILGILHDRVGLQHLWQVHGPVRFRADPGGGLDPGARQRGRADAVGEPAGSGFGFAVRMITVATGITLGLFTATFPRVQEGYGLVDILSGMACRYLSGRAFVGRHGVVYIDTFSYCIVF